METYRKLLDRKNGKENVGFYHGPWWMAVCMAQGDSDELLLGGCFSCGFVFLIRRGNNVFVAISVHKSTHSGWKVNPKGRGSV